MEKICVFILSAFLSTTVLANKAKMKNGRMPSSEEYNSLCGKSGAITEAKQTVYGVSTISMNLSNKPKTAKALAELVSSRDQVDTSLTKWCTDLEKFLNTDSSEQ